MLAALADNLTHHFSGGVYAKEIRIPAGMVLVQHKHHFDHLSLLAKGTIELDVDGARRTISADASPVCLSIEAGKHHGIKALTDAVWFCIHASDCADPDDADQALILPADATQMREIAEALS